MKEWEFREDSEDVDIDRIFKELMGKTVVEVRSYLYYLKINAPRVYDRFAEKYANIGCIRILRRAHENCND